MGECFCGMEVVWVRFPSRAPDRKWMKVFAITCPRGDVMGIADSLEKAHIRAGEFLKRSHGSNGPYKLTKIDPEQTWRKNPFWRVQSVKTRKLWGQYQSLYLEEWEVE